MLSYICSYIALKRLQWSTFSCSQICLTNLVTIYIDGIKSSSYLICYWSIEVLWNQYCTSLDYVRFIQTKRHRDKSYGLQITECSSTIELRWKEPLVNKVIVEIAFLVKPNAALSKNERTSVVAGDA